MYTVQSVTVARGRGVDSGRVTAAALCTAGPGTGGPALESAGSRQGQAARCAQAPFGTTGRPCSAATGPRASAWRAPRVPGQPPPNALAEPIAHQPRLADCRNMVTQAAARVTWIRPQSPVCRRRDSDLQPESPKSRPGHGRDGGLPRPWRRHSPGARAARRWAGTGQARDSALRTRAGDS